MMNERVYVECCERVVPVAQAIPFWYRDGGRVYLCHVGTGCTR